MAGEFGANVQGIVSGTGTGVIGTTTLPGITLVTPSATSSGVIGAQSQVSGTDRPEGAGAIGKGKVNDGGRMLVDNMQFWGVMAMVVMVFAALAM